MERSGEYSEKEGALGAFREELAEIARAEAESGETADFSGIEFRPDELTENDMEIWRKLKAGELSGMDYNAYKFTFGNSESESRMRFLYFVANKLTAQMHEK